ncbi:hypothetical protein SUGI_0317210 [Cryptomeria japonica]|uniref:uncharacterized protein LOC131033648 n=1 Tax=Cryptomeria japonica TaxID=3369 RepID=UPI002408DE73|nr:uncharacterized protein LOC131033648 [Cryptomeria japonica]GLJ18002.1 hypothetical protein SUGI_0317210 [Cryptomeria japonica]
MAGEERNLSVLGCGDPNGSVCKNTGCDENKNDGIQFRRQNLPKVGRKKHLLQKQRSCNELSREEAWLRKKDQVVCEKESRAVNRSVSDCGDRSRCLRDEDLEELRGCIDLGFRFSFDEDHDHLCNTFPALDLYYAINRQFNVSKSKSSPESSSVHGSESCAQSPSSPLSDAWKISSPGENSQEVKTKLRHWAQLVACSVRESC